MKPAMTIEDLPEPIIEYILSYLSPYRDLKQCMQVNKSWYRYVNDVVRKTQRDFFNAVCHMSVQWSHLEADPGGPTITKRYSHSACCRGNSMYIFGGCTTANTTFNDLWRLDLGTRCWIRPLATGTYPPPKACASLVCHSDNLIVFGGWTHTAPYPLQQVFRVFNQIHVYNTTTNRWSLVSTATSCPPVAGHSATVHGDYMVVFGGVQKKETDGPFVISNEIWTLDLKLYKWQKQKTTEVEPPPRYGHSQIPIDKNHLLIIGGNGGSNMLYNDIWLLKMVDGPGGTWEWQKMDIQGKENGAPHLAFHPACKVGSQVVVMSRTHKSRSSTSFPTMMRAPNMIWIPPPPREEDKNNLLNTKRSAPEVEHCVNGKRGVLKRASERYSKAKAPLSSSDEEELQDASKRAALHITNDSSPDKSSDLNSKPGPSGVPPMPENDSNSVPPRSRPDVYPRDGRYPNCEQNSSVEMQSDSAPSSSSLGSLRSPNPPSSTISRKPSLDQNTAAHARRNRQRQLEGIARMEERLNQLKAGNASYSSKQVPQKFVKQKSNRTAKRPMCMYVLDISTVFDGFVTWRTIGNQSSTAPEEIILYSLVLGKGEVIMFGGIQKDLTSQKDTQTVPEIVSNTLHFMTAERVVI